LQRKLGELHRWREQVDSCEPTFITVNGLFAVTCLYFNHSILPELSYISQSTYDFVTAQSVAAAQQFVNELQQFIQVLTRCLLNKQLVNVNKTAFNLSLLFKSYHCKTAKIEILSASLKLLITYIPLVGLSGVFKS